MTLITSSASGRSSSVTSALANQDVRSGSTRRTRIEATSPEPRRFPFDLTDGTVLVELVGEEPDWLYSVLDRLQGLATLPQNWDSYGGSRLTFEATLAALDFMARFLSEHAKEPTIVPASSGGVQLEWHRHVGDLEVTFSPEGALSAFFVDAASGVEWEMDVGNIDAHRLAIAVDAVTASLTH